ncbi:MAG: efflux RND transporter periplasmic adaptor subunit [Cryomorphaceae bacterium]|nr:MAG: efflux RND transporter periplasmic adaptor subunit [Cryomorphaceae bacterium]
MKKLVYFAAVVLFTSCGNDSYQTELDQLKSRRDSLRNVYENLAETIHELEAEIARLDTNKRLTLVTTLPAERDTFRHFFEVYGSVDVKRNAVMVAESPGRVIDIKVKDGDRVQRGQVLIRLDDSVLRKNMAELETSYELALTLYERQERLWKDKIGSEVQYLESKNRKESLENSLATLQEQIQRMTVRAPFSGVAENVMIKLGEMAGAGVPLLRVLDLSEFQIESEVPERYAGLLKTGSAVEIIFPGRDTLNATISSVGSFINPGNRTFRILVDVDAENGKFKPNQLTILRINDQLVPDAVVLPANVIQQDAQGKSFVFIAVQEPNGAHRALKQVVQTGATYKGKTLVRSGLKGNEHIIDKGSRSIRSEQLISLAD